ncbi:MAG: lamin tail domain-containing protein, partial [Anaerolineales bacterium]|nr:lamin tail domain-containing protein [Anaerolineales bacterium]
IIDGRQAFVSSENFSPNSLPYDDKNDGTWGRRGVVFVTDAAAVVEYLTTLFRADFNPAVYHDLYRFEAQHPTYGSPPTNFVPVTTTGGVTYTTRYFEPAVFDGTFSFEMVQSPENSLRSAGGLLGLLAQAEAGDIILVQQLTERPYWGDDIVADPNPRVEAYLAAARRGATVKVLLDSFFDDPSDPLSNSATCSMLKTYAQQEKLDLFCAVANPAGMGIHNKMVLAYINGQGYAHLGSINGTEQSHKGNRELAVQIASNELYTFLADMFYADWPYQSFLPFLGYGLQPRSDHLLISEVLYDPTGFDGSEFIELVNPTASIIDLTTYTIGDAWQKDEFADVRQFPEGAQIGADKTIVIAQQATRFKEQFGFNPDFEILETDPNVPNLVDDLSWGDSATFLQLGNGGDVVVLRNLEEEIVDVISYGDKLIIGVPSCPAVASGHSLRRNPYWQDSNDCQRDFEDWPLPDPSYLP